ncbi:MAG: hypothetical protein V1801_02940 [Candidatus Falkowbacteria bacterium]
MSPLKAILILFILFLIIALGFVLLYLNKQAAIQESLLNSMLPSKSQLTDLKSGSDSISQAELKELDRLRNQAGSAVNNQALNPAQDLQELDKLRQAASATTPIAQEAQADLQALDKLRAQSQTPAP